MRIVKFYFTMNLMRIYNKYAFIYYIEKIEVEIFITNF